MPKAAQTTTTRRPRAAKPDHLTAIEFLSFVQTLPGRGNGRNWWAVPPIGDYALENAFGDGLAHEALLYMRMHEKHADPRGPLLLPSVLKSMVERGVWSGTELGFVRTITRSLIRGLV